MGFKEQAGYATDPDFRKRILVASLTAAVAIQGEAKPGGMKNGEYAKRQMLATKLIQTGGIGNPLEDLQRMFVWVIITNASVTPASEDGEIQFAVNAVFSKCAGATGVEV
jgi:hypothetical protein